MTNQAGLARALGMAFVVSLAACEPAPGAGKFTGYVEAEFVTIAAPGSGWLIKAPLRQGAAVTKGDVLFELDQDLQQSEVAEAAGRLKQADALARNMATGARLEEIAALNAQLEEAKATLRLAESERLRWTKLVERGIAPQARGEKVITEHEAATARVRKLEANIRVARLAERTAAREAAAAGRDVAAAALVQAEWRLAQRTVKAQVAGRIEEVFHRPGEFVAAGAPILSVLSPEMIKVRFFVPQAMLSKIGLNAVVEVFITDRAETLTARVSYIAREAEFTPPVIFSAESRNKLVFVVEARLPNPTALRPGQPVDVKLP